MSQKIKFLAWFQVFFKNKMKTVICLMHYNALHHWSKFQTNFSTFQWVTFKKPPRSSLKLNFLLVWKHLKFQNSRTTDQTQMKIGQDMNHLNTFNIPKSEGVNEWVGGGHNQKTTRKYHEIKRISTFTSSKTSSDNAKEKGIFSMLSITI